MTPPREFNSEEIVAPRPIAERAREAVRQIDNSLRRLTEWNVKVPANSRLHKARLILEHAVGTGLLTPAQRGDMLGLRSLELALDYDHISQTLPEVAISAMRRELRDSLTGDIAPVQKLTVLQLQSQAVVRAAFVRAGLNPRHPTISPQKGKTSPDILFGQRHFYIWS
jgi:hypothetical protein